MSMRAMQELLSSSQAKGLDRAVAAAIAFYANRETGLSFPSNELLRRDWGFSERRIQIALRALEDLGELRRQPALESFEHRRVYLVGSGQLSILDGSDASADLDASSSMRAHDIHAPAEMPSRVKGTEEPKTNTPPSPPASGGGAQKQQTSSGRKVKCPAPFAVERETPARRRRRRRRGQEPAFASEPCPLQRLADGEACDPELVRRWEVIKRRLGERLGDAAAIWFGVGHLHDASDALRIALPPQTVAWTGMRFAAVLAEVADRRVEFVGCEALDGS